MHRREPPFTRRRDNGDSVPGVEMRYPEDVPGGPFRDSDTLSLVNDRGSFGHFETLSLVKEDCRSTRFLDLLRSPLDCRRKGREVSLRKTGVSLQRFTGGPRGHGPTSHRGRGPLKARETRQVRSPLVSTLLTY